MIQVEQIRSFFPPFLRENPTFQKYMLKEYLQLLILDFLTTTPYVRKTIFIGGTNLRLVYRIDRFSEDLDFDCKNLPKDEFIEMTDAILIYLKRSGFKVETRDTVNEKLQAFRRNLYFPEMLLEMGLSGYREERFLIKVESQDQQIIYPTLMTNIKGCGMFFSFPVPSVEVLCAMKISALLSRQKGRDFYDVMFLLGQTAPDYQFLTTKCGITNLKMLKDSIATMITTIDLKQKAKDFEHLLFTKGNSNRILSFPEFVNQLA
jgi:predicted nucleotidyltransferase component of viral defense system